MPSPNNPSADGKESYCFLSSISPSDKPWEVHRSSSDRVRDLYDTEEFERYFERISNCSQWLKFALKAEETGEFNLKLHAAHFCRVRHCPVCQWRRELMWRARFLKAFPRIVNDYPTSRFIFLTLTVRNCQIQDLRQTLTLMNRGWQRMIQRKVWPGQGFVRSTEVTRNPDDGSAHPHFHCTLMVTPSYFTGRGYISQQKWRELWQSCLKVDYLPVVHVEVVKPRGGNILAGLAVAVCETLKYSVKPEDLISDQDWLHELTKQLHKTRAIAVGGVFKNYIDEEDPENLIDGDLEDDGATEEDPTLTFGWREMIKRYLKE